MAERKSQCYLSLGSKPHNRELVQSLRHAIKRARFELVSPRRMEIDPRSHIPAAEAIVQADCVIAVITDSDPTVLFEIGYAQAFEKPILLITEDVNKKLPGFILDYPILRYDSDVHQMRRFRENLTKALTEFQHFPRRSRMVLGARSRGLYAVDWERLNEKDVENLCLELLTQLGFRRVNWETESREIDIVAELPKKDPDGYEYRELWLVSFGHEAPTTYLLDMLYHEPEYFVQRIFRFNRRLELEFEKNQANIPITVLFILPQNVPRQTELFEFDEKLRRRGRNPNLRVRIWDRNYLTSLIYQFPQIGFKYFSDEGRSQSKYRKTPDELYRENVKLSNRLAVALGALKDETDKRVRAERDAVWKDISFSAAHKMGNPIFAIETNLAPLRRRVLETRTDEAVVIIDRISNSIEKAKGIVEQFKSLTKAQDLKPIATTLRPILEDACTVPREQSVVCTINCPPELLVYADPERLSEVFDELASNALHWFDKDSKQIRIDASTPAPGSIPLGLDSKLSYALIHFADNGKGVPVENKSKIFDAFFTTHQHGTGIGLALVRRIVEGHGGAVAESGLPGQGADFEIFIPLAVESNIKRLAGTSSAKRVEQEVANEVAH